LQIFNTKLDITEEKWSLHFQAGKLEEMLLRKNATIHQYNELSKLKSLKVKVNPGVDVVLCC